MSKKLAKYIKSIVNKNGFDILYNEQKVVNPIAVEYKNSAEERKLLKMAYSCGIMAELASGAKQGGKSFDDAITRSMTLVDSIPLTPKERTALVTELAIALNDCRGVKALPTGKKGRARKIIMFLSVVLFIAFTVLYLVNTRSVGKMFSDHFNPFSKALYEYVIITAVCALLYSTDALRSGNDKFSSYFILIIILALIILPIVASIIHGVGFFTCLIRSVVAAVLGFVGVVIGAMIFPNTKKQIDTSGE